MRGSLHGIDEPDAVAVNPRWAPTGTGAVRRAHSSERLTIARGGSSRSSASDTLPRPGAG